MIHNQLTRPFVALSITLGLSLQLIAPALAADDFAANWEARPLVDHSKQPPVTAPSPTPATGTKPATPKVDQAALEARLKPAEPFITSVEKKLLITPKAGSSLVDRLNTLQTVLYGGQKYQDAGELLAQLATVFPAEAAKAQADLNAKLKNSLPPATASQRPIVTQPQMAAATPQQNYAPSGFGHNQYSKPQPKKKKRFWESDDDPFANDPFFQDQPQSSSYQNQQGNGPSALGSVGRGIAGLAMMAGAVAGSYYMNKNSNNALPNNNYYNPGYGYGNYGYPYGYGGVVPPGGYVPYGYGGGVYGNPYYGSPLGGLSVTTQPYQRYGTTTTGISPLGVPTGRYSY